MGVAPLAAELLEAIDEQDADRAGRAASRLMSGAQSVLEQIERTR